LFVNVTGLLVADSLVNDHHFSVVAVRREPNGDALPLCLWLHAPDSKQFTKVTTFSPVMNAAPARIGRAVGEAFTLFGGHIVGRHVELIPARRIVQAWRVVDWDSGIYSIAKFDLMDRGRETTIAFDHTGFPNGKAEHLAEGWRLNYWQPLEKYFG
jgi:activator of Hsp90 ATPase-like protein